MSSISKKSKTNYMNGIKNRKVVEANDLITSIAKMDKTPMKIFELAVSCINTENPPKDNIIYLSKTELFSFFDVSDANKHSRFKRSVEKMQKQAFFQIKLEQDKGYKFQSIVPIPFVEWNDYNDKVKIEFSSHIIPYLIDLKSNFTQYALTDVMDLESKYSIIIYKWLSMSYNQFEHYEFMSNRTEMQLNKFKSPQITMQELREITDTLNIYKDMNNFEKRILKTSMQEINKHTHFNVTYEKIKKGRSIESIQFQINKKENWRNDDYKRDDSAAQISIEKRKLEKKTYYADAMVNPYTTELINKGLLIATDLTNQDTLISLSKSVYPLYDQIIENHGNKELSRHLSYVYSKKIDYRDSKKNIAKYLKISAEQYIGINN